MKKILKRVKWGNLIILLVFVFHVIWFAGSITEVWYTTQFNAAHDYSTMNYFIVMLKLIG